jgi:hypothetical protein
MFCPQCKVEYRQGFTHCADCDVDLVYDLKALESTVSRGDDLRVLWRCVDQQECVSVCHSLQDLGIDYKVTETPGSFGPRMRVTKRYELAVSSADYDRAKVGLEIEDDLPETLSEAEWQEMEEPADPDEVQAPEGSELGEPLESGEADGSLPDTPERRDAYFRYWYPEDATAQIWSGGGDEDFSGGIEMALKENLIHCRVDNHGDDKKVVFVMPEDEPRAREIVREIIEGTPMQ